MVQQAVERGFAAELVAIDSWYSGFPGLKQLRRMKWDWLTQLKSNREVSIDRTGNSSIREICRRRGSGSGYLGNIFLLSIYPKSRPVSSLSSLITLEDYQLNLKKKGCTIQKTRRCFTYHTLPHRYN